MNHRVPLDQEISSLTVSGNKNPTKATMAIKIIIKATIIKTTIRIMGILTDRQEINMATLIKLMSVLGDNTKSK